MRARYLDLLRSYPPPGSQVLEIGPSQEPRDALLSALPGHQRLGLSRAQPAFPPSYPVLVGDGNDMRGVADATVDLVLCNAVLEHDRYFWKTLAEIRRVLRPDGLVYVGVPAYARARSPKARIANALYRRWRHHPSPLPRCLGRWDRLGALDATATLTYHSPPDYYRFSEDAVRHVLLDRLEVVHVEYVHRPVRLLAIGRKPAVVPRTDSQKADKLDR